MKINYFSIHSFKIKVISSSKIIIIVIEKKSNKIMNHFKAKLRNLSVIWIFFGITIHSSKSKSDLNSCGINYELIHKLQYSWHNERYHESDHESSKVYRRGLYNCNHIKDEPTVMANLVHSSYHALEDNSPFISK